MWWLMGDIVSYENNVMLAAILSLLLVLLFVLVLHIYARWFLGHHRASSISMSQVFGPVHQLRARTTYDTSSSQQHPSKGMDPTVLDTIPVFVYEEGSNVDGQECAICLSLFEEKEKGRMLPRCSHGFHMECIDMWLHSHSNCPVCRAQVVLDQDEDDRKVEVEGGGDHGNSSTGEVNRNGGHGNESITSDYCSSSLRRMLSLSSSRSSINRIYPSSLGVLTQV